MEGKTFPKLVVNGVIKQSEREAAVKKATESVLRTQELLSSKAGFIQDDGNQANVSPSTSVLSIVIANQQFFQWLFNDSLDIVRPIDMGIRRETKWDQRRVRGFMKN